MSDATYTAEAKEQCPHLQSVLLDVYDSYFGITIDEIYDYCDCEYEPDPYVWVRLASDSVVIEKYQDSGEFVIKFYNEYPDGTDNTFYVDLNVDNYLDVSSDIVADAMETAIEAGREVY